MPSGSILPVAIDKGKLYFLFGKENPMEDSAKGFSDFGGGIDGNETPFQTALRECSEELTGFFGDSKQLQKHINRNGGVYRIEANAHDPRHKYTVHIMHTEYDTMLPVYYNNTHYFLWNRMDKHLLNDSKLFEKIEIDWFNENDLKSRMKEYRPFYRDIVRELIDQLPQIKKFIQKCNSKMRKTTSKHMKSNQTRKRRIMGG
jgi:8-oxo-dGTP pyrophosphatase MutT (NUDIX family)